LTKKAAADLERKLRKERITLEDFRDQLKQIRKMGPLDKIVDICRKWDRSRIFQGMRIRRGQLTRVEADH